MRRIFDDYTAHHHLRAVLGQGVVSGIFLLNEYVTRKGLGGSRWHILALLLVPAVAQSVAAFWNPTDPGRWLGRRPFRTLGIPACLLLVLPCLPFFPASPALLVALLATVAAAQAFLIPVQNALLAGGYGEATRGRRFGAAVSAQALAIVLVSVPAGWLLDQAPDTWRPLYALAAAAGVFGTWSWSRLRQRRRPPPPPDLQQHASPFKALRRDRHFLAFEACFMVYGLGFLMMQPVLPLYLVDELGVSYAEVGAARGAIFWIAIVVASPFVGRLADRLGVLRVAALAFLALATFPLTLLLLPNRVGLFAAFALYGLAMAGVNLAWNLGPLLLARGRDPLPYLNAHVALVGVRALVGMVGATLLQRAAGTAPVFAAVVALEVLAAAGMWRTAGRAGLRRPPDPA
jgi:MFS family permease